MPGPLVRPLLRLPPMLLLLVVPLGLLAWFGSEEFSRLDERAITALNSEAANFLKTEESKVRAAIESVVRTGLDQGIGDRLERSDTTVLQTTRAIAQEPLILEVFVLDENFRLLAPLAPAVEDPSAPLQSIPLEHDNKERDLAVADVLCTMSDTVGATRHLESYISRFDGDNTAGLIWAQFRLGGLYARAGQLRDARHAYTMASVMAETEWVRAPSEDTAFVLLYSEIRRAEMGDLDLITSAPMADLLTLLTELCAGTDRFPYLNHISDDILSFTVRDLVQFISRPETLPQVDQALELHRLQMLARQFARDFEATNTHLKLALQHRRRGEAPETVFQVLTTENSTSLLALRPTRLKERKNHGGAAWAGLRLDLPALVSSTLAASPTSRPGNIALAIVDPSGIPLLGRDSIPEGETPKLEFPPVESLAGLEFRAIPITDTTTIENALLNRAILGLILVFLAAGGAILLVRTVRRESELAKMKMQLLSRVTHELKTPLAVIKMYGETLGLGRTKDQEQVSRFAGIISAESDRLTNMIERILDFSKMEAGTFSYAKRRIDLSELVEAVTDEYLPHIESQGVELRGDLAPGLMIDADPQAMAGSLVNLLENAVKYTPANAPERLLEVGLVRQNGHAVLEVRDRGLGIPPAELDRVFEDFYRASNAGEARGSGLGLAMVSHFARAHHGKIEAIARPQGGTTMRMSLPLAPDDRPDGGPSDTP